MEEIRDIVVTLIIVAGLVAVVLGITYAVWDSEKNESELVNCLEACPSTASSADQEERENCRELCFSALGKLDVIMGEG